MSKRASKQDPARIQRLLRDLWSDFAALRQRERPVKVTLIHQATNAGAEGVSGYPCRIGESNFVAITGAGNREARLNLGPDGKPRFIDPPVVDVHGEPIIDLNSGQGIDYTMPASRLVVFEGDAGAVERLRKLAERGGRLAEACQAPSLHMLGGWRFYNPEECWWAILFELAWSDQHPLISASKQLWRVGDNGAVHLLPFETRGLAWLAAHRSDPSDQLIPRNWLEQLPDAYLSEIEDAASACVDLTAVLADELEGALPAGNAPTAPPDEGATGSAALSTEPDKTGYVASPSDSSAYVPAAKIVAQHAPAEMSLSVKQLAPILGDFQANRIRWTRPAGKDGKPRINRRSVHLTDWLSYLKRRAAGVETDEGDWPVVPQDEITERAGAIRQHRSIGK